MPKSQGGFWSCKILILPLNTGPAEPMGVQISCPEVTTAYLWRPLPGADEGGVWQTRGNLRGGPTDSDWGKWEAEYSIQ